jgi:alpha-glucosidase
MEVAWGRERLRVDVIRDDVVRLKISRGGVFDETPTFAVVQDGTADHEVNGSILRTAALEVDIETLAVRRADGTPVIEPIEPYGTLNDAFWVRRRYRPEDAIYGLGEKSGRHNRRGRSFTLWNTDILNPSAAAPFGGDGGSIEFDPYYVSIPFFHHHTADGHVAASFVDNGFRATYDFSAGDEYSFRFEGGQYTEYVFAGPSLPGIVEAYTWLTGRAAPPPLWALGYHQCRWKAYSQADVEALGARHRELGIPCDALWLDIEYMDGYRVFTWNTELFPDAPGMLARLREQGLRAITIIDPGVKFEPGYDVFDEAVARDVLCRTEGGDLYIGEVWPGDTAFPDFVTEDGRRWWGERNAAHVRSGLAGIWNDMNEPATGVVPPERMRFNRGADSHERWHNQYALLMAMGTREGLLDAMPDLRTFILTRAGFAGIQRYAANWMGDNQARWDHLWLSIPMANGFGLSGQAFVGADVGGFAGHSNGELFLRWLQYGALTPFCRNHSMLGDVDQYAWSWGEAILTQARRAIELRYRLLPYIYSAFITATETGAPVQRPLVFDHQYDAAVRDIDDQYLLGPDLLVAPVYEPRATARQVYLPAGGWYDWHTGERFTGPQFVVAQTPMDRIPLYARAGAVIPMWPSAPASTNERPDTIELHAFAGAAGTSFLQEDDGLTLAGPTRRTWLDLDGETLRARSEGEFPGSRFAVVAHGGRVELIA